jgi:hypothetical protein
MTDAELIAFCADFRDGILDGGPSARMCAAVCWPLSTLLHLYGVETETVETDLHDTNHIWLRLKDGRALDPTADQFDGLPAVYLGPPLDIHGSERR